MARSLPSTRVAREGDAVERSAQHREGMTTTPEEVSPQPEIVPAGRPDPEADPAPTAPPEPDPGVDGAR